jgi:hypothetical protein
MTGCGRYGADSYISAYDARTGETFWRFSTIAREGQPGGDTWGALPNLLRAGGDTWIDGIAVTPEGLWIAEQKLSTPTTGGQTPCMAASAPVQSPLWYAWCC